MSRALPLGNPNEAIAELVTGALEGTVAIFDPAMCCPTGVCGPAVDPDLLAITRDIRRLEKLGVHVERYGLSQQPDVFVTQPRITGLMQAFGDKALPATLVNDEVFVYGRYPTFAEFEAALSATPNTADASGGCCTPGSGCC
ncbi:hypothetical protein BH09GEM1_BH09GEM1_29900 [soil metagenome]